MKKYLIIASDKHGHRGKEGLWPRVEKFGIIFFFCVLYIKVNNVQVGGDGGKSVKPWVKTNSHQNFVCTRNNKIKKKKSR